MSFDNDIPRPMKVLQVFWPIVAFAIIGGSYAVAAMAQTSDIERRVVDLEVNGTPATRERLARIETHQLEQSKQLDRIEDAVTNGQR